MGWGRLGGRGHPEVGATPGAARDQRLAGKPLPLLSLVMVTVLPTVAHAARHGTAPHGTARHGHSDGAQGLGMGQ